MSPHKRLKLGQQPNARATGVIYLLYFLTAVLAQLLVNWKLVVFGDVVNTIAYGLYVVLTLLFYLLFKPVSRWLSLLAALIGIAGSILGLLDLFHLNPQNISPLLFFAPYCLLIGALIVGSTFLPRILGWLMILAGLGWLAFLSPRVESHLSIPIEAVGILAEASLMFWLLVKGVNVPRWIEQAGTALGGG